MTSKKNDIELDIRKFDMKKLQKESIIVVLGKRNTGKCLAKNTEVLLYNGKVKYVQDITQDDILMGDDSTPRRIIDLTEGQSMMYNVTSKRGNLANYTVNEDHILSFVFKTKKYIKRKKLFSNDTRSLKEKNSRVSGSGSSRGIDVLYYAYYFDADSRRMKHKIFNKKPSALKFINSIQDDRIVDMTIKEYTSLEPIEQNKYLGFYKSIEFQEPKGTIISPYLVGCKYGMYSRSKSYNSLDFLDSEALPYLNSTAEYRYISYLDPNNTIDKCMINGSIPEEYKLNTIKNRWLFLAGYLSVGAVLDSGNSKLTSPNYNLSFTANYLLFPEHGISNGEYRMKSVQFRKEILFVIRSLGISYRDNGEVVTIYGNKYINRINEIVNEGPCVWSLKRDEDASGVIHFNDYQTYRVDIKKLDIQMYYGFQIERLSNYLKTPSNQYIASNAKIRDPSGSRFVLGDFTVTHNSFLVRDILYHLRDIPIGSVISRTDHLTHFYDKFIPGMLIYKKYETGIVEKIFKRQEKANNEEWKHPHSFLLFDDCLADSKDWSKDEHIKEIFFNGRHYKLLFILTLQAPLGIPPGFRTNIDFTFILKNNNSSDREKLFKNYANAFSSKEHFEVVMDHCTSNYECLVIDNTTQSNNIEDQVFYYKAKDHENFKMCDKKIWDFHNQNYNNRGGFSGVSKPNENISTFNRKNGNGKYIIHKKS